MTNSKIRAAFSILIPLYLCVSFKTPENQQLSRLQHVQFAGPREQNVHKNIQQSEQSLNNVESHHCSRRKLLQLTPVLLSLASTASARVTFAAGEKEHTVSYVDRTFRFRIEIPDDWLVSKRPSVTLQGNGLSGILTPNGGLSSTGTVFVAGNFQTGQTVGVSYTDIRKLLDDAGFFSGGPLNKILDVGKPKGVADLLIRQRDGNPKQPSPVSEVIDAKLGDSEYILEFAVKTIIKTAGTGAASRPENINSNTEPTSFRRACARAVIKDGVILTAWTSAVSDQWTEYGSKLENVTRSFEVSDNYAFNQIIGKYNADVRL